MKKPTFKNHQSSLDNHKMRTGKHQQHNSKKVLRDVPIMAHKKDKNGTTIINANGNPELEVIGYRKKWIRE